MFVYVCAYLSLSLYIYVYIYICILNLGGEQGRGELHRPIRRIALMHLPGLCCALLMIMSVIIINSSSSSSSRSSSSSSSSGGGEVVVLYVRLREIRGSQGRVWASVDMRVWACKESWVKRDQTSCYLRPPFLGTPSIPSRTKLIPSGVVTRGRTYRGEYTEEHIPGRN